MANQLILLELPSRMRNSDWDNIPPDVRLAGKTLRWMRAVP